MNSNGRFWEIGLKVIAAAIVGIAVFVGIDRSTSKKSTNFNGQGNNNQEPEPKNNTWSQPGEQQQGQNNNQAPQQEGKRENQDVGEKVVNGLKGMYGTFGKLSQVISSLVDVVGSVGRLFGNDNGYGYPPRQPYYTSNPWGCGCNLGPGLHRVNDYIIQVGPTPGQQYGSNFGYC